MNRGPAGSPPVDRISQQFKSLEKAEAGLPAKVVRFVVEGDNPSILSTLQGNAARNAWQKRLYRYSARHEVQVFTNLADWRVDQMRRMGEAIAAVEPIGSDYGYFGTKKSPDWLRHVVTMWVGGGREAQPTATLLALAEETGQAVPLMLDILLRRDAVTYRSNSVGWFEGVDQWLAGAHESVRAAVPGFSADMRAELAAAIGLFKLQHVYIDLLLDIAIGSSKTARTAARQALTGANAAVLADALRARFPTLAPSGKVALVEVAAALGDAAPALMAAWRTGESSATVVAALDRLSLAVAPAASPSGAETPSPPRVDGPEGYTAVDGSWVGLPPCAPLPGPSPLPPELLRLLEPAIAEFNRELSASKAEAAEVTASTGEVWHRLNRFSFKDQRDLARLARLANGAQPIQMGRDQWAVGWLDSHQLKQHPTVSSFLHDSRLTLYHLIRLAVAMSNGYLPLMLRGTSGPVGTAVRHRLTQGADIRAVLALWQGAGGHDLIKDHLTRRPDLPLPELETPIWPVLCQRFAQLDEALGLAPQSGSEAMQRMPAIDLLRKFPKLPERYRGPLMLLADDSSVTLRQAARALLDRTPDLGHAIALQLQDRKQATRARAAGWLAARGERQQALAIREALAKERSDLARAAMISGLERLGEDVSEYFDRAMLLEEAKAGLARSRPKGLEWLPFDRLPALKWKDGTPVDPLLPQWWVLLAVRLGQPGGNALINLWLDQLQPEDAQRLGWMVLSGWIDEDTRVPTDEEANAYALQHVDATLRQNLSLAKQFPGSAHHWPIDKDVVFAKLKKMKAATCLGSGLESKGVLALATRMNGSDAAQCVRRFLKDHGSRVSQAKGLLELLAAIGSDSALQLLLSAANRSKQRSVQAYAAVLVDAVAGRNGWNGSQLADRTVPTGGFGADGMQELDCGGSRRYRLQLDSQDSVVILNAEGRKVKGLPGPRVDEERAVVEAAKRRLAGTRKEVRQVLAAQAERLQQAMCLQRNWTRAEWENFVVGHPIVSRLAIRMVWLGLDAEGRVVTTFRPLGDGSYTDATDSGIDLAMLAHIRLAHASLLDEATVAAWRTHLVDYAVSPPFDQLGREPLRLAEGQGRARTITDRVGWMVESFKLRAAATKLGYRRGRAQDGGWFVTYEKTYAEAGLVAEIEFTGSPLSEESRPTALQALSFRALRAGTGSGGQVALADVPPVLLAECWCDLHDIAGRGTGFDPEWQKKACA